MSSLIKHATLSQTAKVGLFKGRSKANTSLGQSVSFTGPAPTLEQRALEIAHAALENMQDEITRLKAQSIEAVEAAYTKGKEDAQVEFIANESDAISALEAGVEIGLELYKKKLQELEQASLMAARSVLVHLFSDTDQIRAAVERNILAQIRKFDKDMILGVTVSKADFATPQARASIANLNLNDSANVSVSRTLEQGAFEIEMRLGHLEFSLANSLGEIKALFEAASVEGGII
jgi:hypothetical protein